MTHAAAETSLALRLEIREWLETNLNELRGDSPSRRLTEDEEFDLRIRYAKRLASGGWVGLSWDKRFGGRGMTFAEQLVFHEESVRADAPDPLSRMGTDIMGPAIAVYGTDEQRDRFLPPTLAVDIIWCQGFSEPGAGSDLASLSTRATRDGEGWRISGQKIWTSHAQHADYCLLLARTDPEARPHAGISAFAVDMTSPGVKVVPIETITGNHEFSEVFYDNVFVPGDCLIGEPGLGWKFAMTALEFERSINFMARQVRLGKDLDDLIERVRQHSERIPSRVKDRLVDVYVKSQELQATIDFHIDALVRGERPGSEANATKVFWSETNQELTDLGAEVDLLLGERPSTGNDWSQMYLSARANTIYAGSSEIQRNIIAERGLGMPR